MKSVGIIDVGIGNLRSLSGAIHSLGGHFQFVTEADFVTGFDALILAGVGHFGAVMSRLHANGLSDSISDYVLSGRPVLGICLGMQLLGKSSAEGGLWSGLNLVSASTVPLPRVSKARIPHVGWNQVDLRSEHHLFRGIATGTDFYFVHGYHVVPEHSHVVLGTSHHGVEFVSAIGHENVMGVQFHPEKSQLAGRQLLENFLSYP